MLQISILAYFVGSMFLSTAYSELLYQLIAMSVSLAVIARAEAAAEAAAAPALARRTSRGGSGPCPSPASPAVARRA